MKAVFQHIQKLWQGFFGLAHQPVFLRLKMHKNQDCHVIKNGRNQGDFDDGQVGGVFGPHKVGPAVFDRKDEKGEAVTVAEIMKKAGYATGAFGKWGLGYPGSEGDANNQGFDEFFGYNCQMLGHHYYPYFLRSNQDSLVLEANAGDKTGVYAPNLIHEKTLQFIEDNKDKPFFLYVPSIIPHAELFAPEEYMAKYRGKFDPEHSYRGVDGGPGFRKGGYGSQPESHAAFAAMIDLLDVQVGEIVAKVNIVRDGTSSGRPGKGHLAVSGGGGHSAHGGGAPCGIGNGKGRQEQLQSKRDLFADNT